MRQVLALAFIFSITIMNASASEKFILSATNGRSDIILRLLELDHNKIKVTGWAVITANADYGITNTAVTFQEQGSQLYFDVYYALCQDMECARASVSMFRVDSNLNAVFQKDFPLSITALPELITERLEKHSGFSPRLLLHNKGGEIVERKLRVNGTPGAPSPIGFSFAFMFSASEDGRMIARDGDHSIEVRTLHPSGPIKKVQLSDQHYLSSLAISGPIQDASAQIAGPTPVATRYLFFRDWRSNHTAMKSRVMVQQLDNATATPVGVPKAFTTFKDDTYYTLFRTITVSPSGRIVFYSELDSSCNKKIVLDQVFDPISRTKIGSPQPLIGCSDFQSDAIIGMHVTQFQP